MNRLFAAVILATLYTSLCRADDPMGTVQIVVQNVQGDPSPNTPVYLSEGHGCRLYSTDQSGSVTIGLPAGNYTFSSAMSLKNDDVIDRFASPEAHIYVSAGDMTSVVLHLSALPDAVSSVELSTLRKIGVDLTLAKDLN